ncbi:uncharacterized protein si:ch211-227n13.3 isoform X1 [Scomber scombrus]|uniref:uncharacterized protein si:ch211-227n13.3 isoform X1 n=1 Tax=Scomber scombrus TaxID=13677 RepID=UPI002DD9326B|nr:uncharacterized protein si:ch211-227n13.3 isoform X1 [Scomber scombrus]
MKQTKHPAMNMSYERPETETAADNLCEVDGFHSLSIRVEYYRSLEYNLKWESHMFTKHSSRLQNSSKKNAQESPSPNKDVIQRRLRSRRHPTWQKEADDGEVNTDEGSRLDIIDLINSTHDEEHVAVEDDGKFVEVPDKGVDESDEDCGSDNGSIVSGPSFLQLNSPKKLKPLYGLCQACRKLYQKAKKMKAPIKDKLLDNDPSSLTCDQWVLLKQWRPRRLPDSRGNLELVKRRLVKNKVKRSEQYLGDSCVCSRPHTFLQRNLRRCVQVPAKKQRKNRKKGKKRARDDSQGSRVAKQKRLHGNNAGRHTSINCADDNGHGRSPGSEGWRDEERDDTTDAHVTEIIPSSVTYAPTVRIPTKQKAAKNTSGFRSLLTQILGNTSVIVRETRK